MIGYSFIGTIGFLDFAKEVNTESTSRNSAHACVSRFSESAMMFP